MNYDHAFHAGNHADVLKHLVLVAMLEALARKPAPYFVLDTHAGQGRYGLQAEAAHRSGEARDGIERLQARLEKRSPLAPALAAYMAAIAPELSQGTTSAGSSGLLRNQARYGAHAQEESCS